MEKREYVKRLKGMINSRYETCKCCPCEPYYGRRGSGEIDDSLCRKCQSFVGLDFRSLRSYEWDECCPCGRPGKLGAVARALQKIEEYEAKFGEV